MRDMSRQRLGHVVRQRRLACGFSVQKAAKQAGISRDTWIALEAGTRGIQTYLHAAVEAVLGWDQGSVSEVLAGGDPTPTLKALDLTKPIGWAVLEEIEREARFTAEDKAFLRNAVEIVAAKRAQQTPAGRGDNGNSQRREAM